MLMASLYFQEYTYARKEQKYEKGIIFPDKLTQEINEIQQALSNM